MVAGARVGYLRVEVFIVAFGGAEIDDGVDYRGCEYGREVIDDGYDYRVFFVIVVVDESGVWL